MGHDYHQSSSSGAIVAIVLAVMLVGIVGLFAVAGAGLFLVGTTPSVVGVRLAEVGAKQATVLEPRVTVTPQIQRSSVGAIPNPRLNFEVKLDREGNASVDGEGIDLDELRARLAKLKDETSNVFSVRINADPECPVKLLVPVLDMVEEVGDIGFRVASSDGTPVQMTATVASYEPAAEWDHFDDGTFSAYDKLTLKVVAPQGHAGAMFSVTVPPTELPETSAFRTAGTRLTFTLSASDIAATGLSWGAIGDPTIEE